MDQLKEDIIQAFCSNYQQWKQSMMHTTMEAKDDEHKLFSKNRFVPSSQKECTIFFGQSICQEFDSTTQKTFLAIEKIQDLIGDDDVIHQQNTMQTVVLHISHMISL